MERAKRISDVIYTLYDTSPEGICGNDDTGQMSAWYVMSSMGFYPVTHGPGVYFIGTPIFGEMSVKASERGVDDPGERRIARKSIFSP